MADDPAKKPRKPHKKHKPHKKPLMRRPPIAPPTGPPGEPPAGPPPPPDRPLNDAEQRFVEEYLIDFNRTAAYMRANPGTDHRRGRMSGSEISRRPWVRAEIRAARYAQTVRCRVRADAVLEELARLAFSDILDLFDENTALLRMPRAIPAKTRRAIASIRVSRVRSSSTTSGKTRTTVAESVVEYRFWPKVDALEKLCGYLGLKTAIPPLDALMAALPEPLRSAVRAALLEPAGATR